MKEYDIIIESVFAEMPETPLKIRTLYMNMTADRERSGMQ